MNAPQPPQRETATAPIRRWFFRTKGLFIMATCIAMVFLGGFVLGKIAEQSQRNPDLFKDLPPLVTWVVGHRSLLIIAVAPAFVFGLLAMPRNRTLAAGWAFIIAGTLWLIALFVMILYCFLSFLAPLYQVQPL